MLIQFSAKNFFSLKERITLDLRAAKSFKELVPSHTFEAKGGQLLRSAAIYGANASGKTNVLKAFSFLKSFVVTSAVSFQGMDVIPVEPFLLATATENQPSEFELLFERHLDGVPVIFRYVLSVSKEAVVFESLSYYPKNSERLLFERRGQTFTLGPDFRKEGGTLVKEELIRPNASFLSVAAQFNGKISQTVLSWFVNLNVVFGLEDVAIQGFVFGSWSDEQNRQDLMKYIAVADPSLTRINIEKRQFTAEELGPLPAEIRDRLLAQGALRAVSAHTKFDEQGQEAGEVVFDLQGAESNGTKMMFTYSPLIRYTLENGAILVVDELDARLHPHLTQFLISLFHSTANAKNAQLIFSTHNAGLLNKSVLRRDQVWFTEKDRLGATSLYSLADYKVRNDASFEKDYLSGKFGAIPDIDDSWVVKEV